MQEVLFRHNFNMIQTYSIANISYPIGIIVNTMQLVFFDIIRYHSIFFILVVHNVDINEF
jgi:hypothetical protein